VASTLCGVIDAFTRWLVSASWRTSSIPHDRSSSRATMGRSHAFLTTRTTTWLRVVSRIPPFATAVPACAFGPRAARDKLSPNCGTSCHVLPPRQRSPLLSSMQRQESRGFQLHCLGEVPTPRPLQGAVSLRPRRRKRRSAR